MYFVELGVVGTLVIPVFERLREELSGFTASLSYLVKPSATCEALFQIENKNGPEA